MISDIKEHLEQKQASPDSEPKSSFQASVDIPSEGIHKEISDGDTIENLVSPDTS